MFIIEISRRLCYNIERKEKRAFLKKVIFVNQMVTKGYFKLKRHVV